MDFGFMRAVLYDAAERDHHQLRWRLSYEKTTYDQFGRVYQVFDTGGDGRICRD